MRRAPRGYVLLFVMIMLSGLVALAMLINSRLASLRLARQAEDHRMQALWLARSAAVLGRTATHDVVVAGDKAHVEARKVGSQWVATAGFAKFGEARVAVTLDAAGGPTDFVESYERRNGS